MQIVKRLGVVLVGFLLCAGMVQAGDVAKLDFDWQFHLGEVKDGFAVNCPDKSWRTLDLPHDWSIEDLDAKTLMKETATDPEKTPRRVSGPFDSWAANGLSEAFTRGGTGWYRKHFSIPNTWKGKRILVQFDGVYMNADVWINGTHLGKHAYGYTSFTYDLTDHLKAAGESNVLAVEVKNVQPSSRWYTGSGIYRHVWLKAFDSVHVANWGVAVVTPNVSREWAKVDVAITVNNDTGERTDVEVETALVDPSGATIDQAVRQVRLGVALPGIVKHEFRVGLPKLWEPKTPWLYTAVTTVRRGGKVLDRQATPFGIRSIEFDARKGFLLNDVPTLLKGANIHHDNGPLGAAAYDRADERKIELLKASGFNAVRLSHNPPAPELLDACDRLGMLVIDEFFDYWDRPKKDKSHYDVFAATWEQDLENTILRDRNHPSIILWSIGNEIRDQFNDHGAIWAKRLADKTRALDPSREVTASLCRIVGEDIDWPTREPFMSALDVVGYNYMLEFYEESHRREPNRVIMSAESRGREAFDYWMAVEDHAYIVGDFVWTGMDYLGEVAVGWLGFGKRDYPWIAAYCGDLDLCGFKRPYAYYRNVLWGDTGVYPVVHNPDPSAKFGTPYQKKWGYPDADMSWTWPGHEGEKLKVDVFSRCERVRLLVNGTDYGVVYPNRESKFIAGWNEVVYEPGILQVIGYEGPNEVACWSLRTAGAAARIRMTADRTVIHADKQDLVYVTLEVVDGQGLRLPQAEIPIQLKVEGGGALIGFGNGNPTSVESFQQSVRTTFEGRCMAIIKAGDTPGPIRVTATAPNLKSDKLEIQTR